MLDDGSALNKFTMKCEGTTMGVEDDLGVFTAGVPSPFPNCLAQCSNFYIGNKQYTAENTTDVIRTGDTYEFFCPDGFYVEGMTETDISVIKPCLYTGLFEFETKTCVLIPCNDADILAITPPEGDFETTASGEIMPADPIYFTCVAPNTVSLFPFYKIAHDFMVLHEDVGK